MYIVADRPKIWTLLMFKYAKCCWQVCRRNPSKCRTLTEYRGMECVAQLKSARDLRHARRVGSKPGNLMGNDEARLNKRRALAIAVSLC